MESINKIYNMDCIHGMRQMPDKSVDLVVTDPPYLIETSGAGIYKHDDKQYVKELNEMKDGFSREVLDELCRIMKKINIYFFCSQKQIIPLVDYFVKEKNCNWNLLTWHKCLIGSTEIWCRNKNGEIFKSAIKDLYRHTNVGDVQVLGKSSWTNIHNVTKTTLPNYIEIQVANGNYISCSEEHVFVINGKNIKAKDIKPGNVLDHLSLTVKGNTTEYVSNILAWFIGYYIANGSMSGQKIQIATHTDKTFVLNNIDALCKQYNGKYFVYDKPNSKARSIVVSSQIILGALSEYVSGHHAEGKHLSTKCWNTNCEFLENIFAGYLDGDGYYDVKNDRYRINFTRKNYMLANDIKTLCNILNYSISMSKGHAKFNGKEYGTWCGNVRFNPTEKCLDMYTVKDIVKHNRAADFYDLQLLSDDHLFVLSDGILTHNCNPVPACGNKYLTDTEFILFFREKGVKIYGEYKSKFTYYVTPLNQKDKKAYGHPTIKPLDMVSNFIINSSKEGDIVFDPFMGSGTTAVAAMKCNRNFLGYEVNPDYYEICNKRIKEASENI